MPAAAPREDEREETLSDLLRETIDLAEAVADTVPEQRINANLNRILLAPLLLLDIDGVINVLHPTRPGYLSVNTNSGGSIHYRPDVLQRLVRLHNTGAVEIRWLTAWFGSAHDHLEPSLQLPCWPIEGRVAGHHHRLVEDRHRSTRPRRQPWPVAHLDRRRPRLRRRTRRTRLAHQPGPAHLTQPSHRPHSRPPRPDRTVHPIMTGQHGQPLNQRRLHGPA